MCDFTHGTTFLVCPLSPLTVSGLQAAVSPHACTTHLSPKAGTVEACKEVAWATGPGRQAWLWRGQVTKLGQDPMMGAPYAQEAVRCGDWTTAVGEVKASGHRHTGPRVYHLAVGRRQRCGGMGASYKDSARCDDEVSDKVHWVTVPLEGMKGSYWGPAPPLQAPYCCSSDHLGEGRPCWTGEKVILVAYPCPSFGILCEKWERRQGLLRPQAGSQDIANDS